MPNTQVGVDLSKKMMEILGEMSKISKSGLFWMELYSDGSGSINTHERTRERQIVRCNRPLNRNKIAPKTS